MLNVTFTLVLISHCVLDSEWRGEIYRITTHVFQGQSCNIVGIGYWAAIDIIYVVHCVLYIFNFVNSAAHCEIYGGHMIHRGAGALVTICGAHHMALYGTHIWH